MSNCKRIFTLLSCVLFAGCATTNRQKRFLTTAAGVSLGVTVGLNRPEEPTKNAILYGSLIGLGAAVASEFIFDDEKENARIKKESEKLKSENEILRSEVEPREIGNGSSLLTSPIPKDVQKLVTPGNWRRFKIDRWTHDYDNENQWIRQTEIFEITPPRSGSR